VSECREVADTLRGWLPKRLRSYDAALVIARHAMPGESAAGTIIANVAWHLWRNTVAGLLEQARFYRSVARNCSDPCSLYGADSQRRGAVLRAWAVRAEINSRPRE
jgi:hypothetical protein